MIGRRRGAEPRTALAALVRSPRTGRVLRFVSVHLYRSAGERLAQARRLEEHLAGDTLPTVLAGDFNSTPGSLTFPSYEPAREIDFVLLRPGRRFQVLGQRLMTEPVASDHRAVLVDLVLRH